MGPHRDNHWGWCSSQVIRSEPTTHKKCIPNLPKVPSYFTFLRVYHPQKTVKQFRMEREVQPWSRGAPSRNASNASNFAPCPTPSHNESCFRTKPGCNSNEESKLLGTSLRWNLELIPSWNSRPVTPGQGWSECGFLYCNTLTIWFNLL